MFHNIGSILDEFEYSGIADAVTDIGFLALVKKALDIVSVEFRCTYSMPDFEAIGQAREHWAVLMAPLPLATYTFKKMDLMSVAVLIQAASTCRITSFTPEKDTVNPLVTEFPNEILALVMGLVLYDIAQRTAQARRGNARPTRSYFLPIDRLNGSQLRLAVKTMIDKGSRNHQRRFSKLLKILRQYERPVSYH